MAAVLLASSSVPFAAAEEKPVAAGVSRNSRLANDVQLRVAGVGARCEVG